MKELGQEYPPKKVTQGFGSRSIIYPRLGFNFYAKLFCPLSGQVEEKLHGGPSMVLCCTPLKGPAPVGTVAGHLVRAVLKALMPPAYKRLNLVQPFYGNFFFNEELSGTSIDCCQWTENELNNDAFFVLGKQGRWELSQKQRERKKILLFS